MGLGAIGCTTPIFGLLTHLGAFGAQNGAQPIFGLRLVHLKRLERRLGRRLEGRVQSLAVEHQIRPKVARAHLMRETISYHQRHSEVIR